MDEKLRAFLARHAPVHEGHVSYVRARLHFRSSSYLSNEMPPDEFITSIRAVVNVSDRIVMLENADGLHYLPGGRREPGETYLQTLKREVQEETGLTMMDAELAGFVHLQHLTPAPPGYPYPYPDMVHLVYLASACGEVRSGDVDGYEEQASLVDAATLLQLPDRGHGGPFLARAIERR